MARAAATPDVSTAIAEPQHQEVLALRRAGEAGEQRLCGLGARGL